MLQELIKVCRKHPVLKAHEERDAFILLRSLDPSSQAFKKQHQFILLSNLKLVFSIASRYNSHSLSCDDLNQEGIIGLMKGIERFDHTKNVKFSTYASYWIMQSILLAIKHKDRLIRLAPHIYALNSKIEKALHRLIQKLDREPTKEEIAIEAGLSLYHTKSYEHLFSIPIALHGGAGNSDNNMSLEEIIPSHEYDNDFSDHIVLPISKAKILKKMDKKLTRKEKEVVHYLFGFKDGTSYTASEISVFMNLSKERIRQIKNKSFAKLGIENDSFITKFDRR